MTRVIRLQDLRRIGLDGEFLDCGLVHVTCRECGEIWFVDGRRRRGWRICANECNAPAARREAKEAARAS